MANLPKVVIHNDQTESFAEMLKEALPEIDLRECNTYEALPGLISEFQPDIVYSVKFAGNAGFPCDALFAQDGPKWVSNGGAGTDHYGKWDTGRTTVTNSAGVAAYMMSEYMFGGFLHFTLNVPRFQQDKQAREWNMLTVRPLKGATLVIVGLGGTGRAIAAKAKAFGMKVVGTRANPQPMEHVDEVLASDQLLSLLPTADFVAVCTPLTPATHNLLAEAEFAAMKPGVIIGDVSRGHVIKQSALLDALDAGKVAAAVLDVFEEEPLPKDNPLWDYENVLISPHCSSVHEGWYEESFEMFLKNLKRYIAGEALQNVVDPERGY